MNSTLTMQNVGTATLSTQHNRQKLAPGHKANYSSNYSMKNGPKGAYVPPHLRNKVESQCGANTKTQTETNTYKSNQKSGYRTIRSDKSTPWKSSGDESGSKRTQSNFQSWNKKEVAKKEKKEEKVIIKPHCELYLTNLPPNMQNIGGLAAFFHPYGEVAQIQMISPNDPIPEAVQKWCMDTELEPSQSAVVEFLTARTAKFVVGVLRKRLAQLNFRVGLIKPGLGDELAYQSKTYGDISHNGITNQFIVTKTVVTDTSSDSSEVEARPQNKRIVKRLVTTNRIPADQAYWSQSSSTMSSSENSIISSSESDPPSDSEKRSESPVSQSSGFSNCAKIAEIDEVIEELSANFNKQTLMA